MTDPFAEGAVHDQGDGAPFVLRLSKTASGSLTYTIGASMERGEVPEAVVDALFSLRDLVEERMALPVMPERRTGQPSMLAALRKSVLVKVLEGAKDTLVKGPTGGNSIGYMDTSAIVSAVKGHRSQVVADLKALVESGVVEKQQGIGGKRPSLYRLVQEGTSKGKKVANK